MSSKDKDLIQGASNSKSKPSGNCIIHCTDASDNLVRLQSVVMFCVIWYHLYNLKILKQNHAGVLLLVKLQAFILQLY